jgi:DNA-binding transcriptional LysR family regulator
MDFVRLSVFSAVARHQSFSRAAEALHLSQPAVSKHIRQLEAELGVQLLHRRSAAAARNRVELTDAGRILADYAQRVSVLTEEVRRVLGELEGLQRGYLRVGASTTPGLYLLPQVLARFQEKYPGIEAALTIANSADITRRVLNGEVDLGFVGVPTEVIGLQVRPFAEDEIVLIVPPGHSLAQQRAFAPGLLAEDTLILREAGSGTRQIVEPRLIELGARPRRVMEIAGCEAVKRAVAAGLGVAFVSRHAIALEMAQQLVSIPNIPELRFRRPLFILTRKDARPSAAALAFLALAAKSQW